MTTITQAISSLGDLPDIADPSTFEPRMNGLVTGGLPTLRNEINAWAGQANTLASEIEAYSEIAALLVGPGGSVAATRAALGAGPTGDALFAAATVAAAKALLPIQSGAGVVATSGTAIDFTGIPSWAKRVTMSFSALSTNGTSLPIVQLGDSGGVENSGYAGCVYSIGGGAATNLSSGFAFVQNNASASVHHGAIVLTLLDVNTNTWSAASNIGLSNTGSFHVMAGSKALSATLDRVRLTTAGGTDTFDAGLVNIMYE